MFGFFKKQPAWNCLMGWRVLTYEEGQQWLSLQIEPMKDAPCRVYVPTAGQWQAEAPAWARELRGVVLERARAVRWNRDVVWQESARARFWQRHVYNPVAGSLESTPGGQQLERMRLFHPDSPARFSRHDSKRAWCAGAEQMCLQVAGNVDIDQREVIPGSVFQEIELPALGRNPRVRLNFAEAA